MDGVIRYLARDALAESLKQAIAKNEPGMWVRAADFDERQAQGKQREVALQDRLTALEEWADELGPVILNALRDEDTVRDPARITKLVIDAIRPSNKEQEKHP